MKLSNEFKIGFWVIVALAVLFFGVNYLKGINTLNQGSFYYLKCDKVDNLAVSSSIKLHGLKVGTVRSMEYDKAEDCVVVCLNVYDSKMRIPVDSRVSVLFDMLGHSDIILEMGESGDCYRDWDTIQAPAAAPGLLEKADPIIAQVNDLMPKLDTLISGINVLVNESKVHESLLEINTMTTHLNQTVNELNRLLRNDVPGIMGNVESASANLDTLTCQLKEAEVQRVLANADKALTQVNTMLSQMKSDDSSVGRLLNSPDLYDQLGRTVADIDSLISDIKANPKRYIHIKVF